MVIAVCDDQKQSRDYLTNIIINSEISKAMPVHSFESGEELLHFCKSNKVDLIFLDIEMTGLNGVDVANRLNVDDYGALIIFVTNYADYLKDAFRASVFQYLIKPVSVADVEVEIERAVDAYIRNHMQYCCKKYAYEYFINYEDIFYIESRDKRKFIYTLNATYETSGSLADDVIKMQSYGFVQCHKSYLINMKKIQTIDKIAVVLTDNKVLPVSKSFKNIMMQSFNRFIERRKI